jgi:hypothetical protein
MNNTKRSPKEQSSAYAWPVEAKATLKRVSVRFPSYLHAVAIFFQHFDGGLGWGIAPSHVGVSKRFPMVRASMAFV